jgi:hypothetical protein
MSGLSYLDLHKNQRIGPFPNHVSGLFDFTSLLLHYSFMNNDFASWLFTLPSLMELIFVDKHLLKCNFS